MRRHTAAISLSLSSLQVRAEDALDHVAGYCVALDMTDRAAQEAAKAARRPWSMAKGWDTSLPVSREVGVNIYGSSVARHDWLLQQQESLPPHVAGCPSRARWANIYGSGGVARHDLVA